MTTSTYLALGNLSLTKPTPMMVKAGDKFTQDSAWVIPVAANKHHIDPAKITQTAMAVKLSTP
jgi:hypothetical protein